MLINLRKVLGYFYFRFKLNFKYKDDINIINIILYYL